MDKLHISTLNSEGLKRSRDYLHKYLNDSSCDTLCVQESWQLDDNVDVFSTIHLNYLYTAISRIDSKESFLSGRPKGGVGIFYKKSLSNKIKQLKTTNTRVLEYYDLLIAEINCTKN